jgi:hypothetical protein
MHLQSKEIVCHEYLGSTQQLGERLRRTTAYKRGSDSTASVTHKPSANTKQDTSFLPRYSSILCSCAQSSARWVVINSIIRGDGLLSTSTQSTEILRGRGSVHLVSPRGLAPGVGCRRWRLQPTVPTFLPPRQEWPRVQALPRAWCPRGSTNQRVAETGQSYG